MARYFGDEMGTEPFELVHIVEGGALVAGIWIGRVFYRVKLEGCEIITKSQAERYKKLEAAASALKAALGAV